MCGIIGYIGHQPVYPLLIEGLKRLEYRGYDSAGVAIHDTDVRIYKCRGKIRNLEDVRFRKGYRRHSAGIGHTRWATHGEPNDVNAHPHISENGHFILVHNGIIENFAVLKANLRNGAIALSETDTEVLVNLIEYIYLKGSTGCRSCRKACTDKSCRHLWHSCDLHG
jgi:glutamine---fructose-6-phosphate transaminase (isomerizing)